MKIKSCSCAYFLSLSLTSSSAEGRVNQSNWFPVGPKARRGGSGAEEEREAVEELEEPIR